MSTADVHQTAAHLQSITQRIHEPLARLRQRIRFYVIMEGLLLAGLYLATWFWISLAVDYGLFRLFTIDLVQGAPYSFRAVLLTGLLAGLLAIVVLRILLRALLALGDRALAMVLERRFPIELNDRLITAVELGDPQLTRKLGYSSAMVEETMRDASERLQDLDLELVFDWTRLRRYTLRLGIGTLGVFLLVGIIYCVAVRRDFTDYIQRFRAVAGLWFERNILLTNATWPRRAYLELVGFPENGELRIGRNAPPPTLRVRSYKWVLADSSRPEGWRPVLWSDLTKAPLELKVPTDKVPANWQTWSLDTIEQTLDRRDPEDALPAETTLAVRDTFAQLDLLADSPRMVRILRKLIIPERVEVLYQGETMRSEQTLQKQQEKEYGGALSDLRESVQFTVRGEDYYTPARAILVVPPPTLVELTRDELRPAYLYHRLVQGTDSAELRGKMQEFRDLPVSLSGTVSPIDVPLGSDLRLRGRIDKPLQRPDGVQIREAGNRPLTAALADDHHFVLDIKQVTAPLDLTIEYTDTDGVRGWRQVRVRPVEDVAPEVDVLVEVIRKTRQGYLVTPRARIPFSGRIRDDHGLDKIEYLYTLESVSSQTQAPLNLLTGSWAMPPLGLPALSSRLAFLALFERQTRSADQGKPPEHQTLGSFERRVRDRALDHVPITALGERLKAPPRGNLLRDHILDPVDEFFDVEKLELQVSDERQVQPHYRLRLWLQATDSNVETGPGVGESKERFTFEVVSENELLAEIGKEEESLHLKLEDTVNRLKESRNKLEQVAQELPGLKSEEFSPIARRAEELTELLGKALDITREVHTDYRRILRELQANRVQPGIINRVARNICDPLELAIGQEFVRSEEALRAFHKTLEARQVEKPAVDLARKRYDELIDRLDRVLEAMGDVTTINKLISLLVEIEKGERAEYDRLKKIRDTLQEKILDDVLGPGAEEKKP